MKEIILKTEKLSKHYGGFTALDNVDLTVYKNDIYGLIGRNGAGKTTIMKVVTGLACKSSGEFSLFEKTGASVENERNRIGCLIENPAFFGNMTAYDNLKYYCLQKGITDLKQIDEVLELVKLTEVKNQRVSKFSLGMKQRLGIVLAMLDNPDLAILDEPINGLDPIGISELRDTFRRLNQEKNVTFIISSHILSELYAVANRFLFIDKGRVLKEISKEELDMECSRCTVVKADNLKKACTVIEQDLGVFDYKVIDGEELRIFDKSVKPSDINKTLVKNDIEIKEISESGVSLEDYFKRLVGGEQ